MKELMLKILYLFFVVATVNATRGFLLTDTSSTASNVNMMASMVNVSAAYLLFAFDGRVFRQLAGAAIFIGALYPFSLSSASLFVGLINKTSVWMIFYSFICLSLSIVLIRFGPKDNFTFGKLKYFDYVMIAYLVLSLALYSKTRLFDVSEIKLLDMYYVYVCFLLFSFPLMLVRKVLSIIPLGLTALWSVSYVIGCLWLFGFHADLSCLLMLVFHALHLGFMIWGVILKVRVKPPEAPLPQAENAQA